MSVANESAAFYPSAAEYTNWKNAFDELTRAIQRGELAAARKAFATLDRQLSKGGTRTTRGKDDAFLQSLYQIDEALRFGAIGEARQALAMHTRPRAAHRLLSGNPATNSDATATADLSA